MLNITLKSQLKHAIQRVQIESHQIFIPLHAIWNKLFFSNLLKTLPFSSTNCKCQSNMLKLTKDLVTCQNLS